MTVRLATGRYRTFEKSMGVPVAISLGKPKWPLPYQIVDEIRRLMPWGLLNRDLDFDEFTLRYRERLDRTGVEALAVRFEQIASEHGEPVVLLCWEDLSKASCHRRVFANWWTERTGESVPELEPTPRPKQMTLEVES